MNTLFHYLAVIGWVWCAIAMIALYVLVKRKKRMESLPRFEVAPQRSEEVTPDETHAK